MDSLFTPAGNAALVRRIRALSPASRALWGKMDVAQMLAHCRPPLLVALGELRLRRSLAGILFGRLAKRKLASPAPFPRGLPTAPEYVVREPRDFAPEQEALVALVQRFAAGPGVLAPGPHPFFGRLTTEEWDRLQWKHLDHHLRQFGV